MTGPDTDDAGHRATVALRGYGDVRFALQVDILQRPLYWEMGLCSDVVVDEHDRLWVASRGSPPISVWSNEGAFLGSWAPGDLREIHHLAVTDGGLWLADDQLHVVRRYGAGGDLALQLGRPGFAMPAVTHAGMDGGPFNMPTGIALGHDGRVFVSDGYGNRQVHRFSAEGQLERSWGRSGEGPGEFSVVHGVTVAGPDRVLVCDRENTRIQVFDYDGGFVAEWGNVLGPTKAIVDGEGLVYVAEMGWPLNGQPNGLTILSPTGEVVGHWHGPASGDMVGGHGIGLDAAGNVYLADLMGRRVVKLIRER